MRPREVAGLFALYLLLAGVDHATRTQVRCTQGDGWSCAEEPELPALRGWFTPDRQMHERELNGSDVTTVHRPGLRGWALVLREGPRRFHLPVRDNEAQAQQDADQFAGWLQHGADDLVLHGSPRPNVRYGRCLYGLLLLLAAVMAARTWWTATLPEPAA